MKAWQPDIRNGWKIAKEMLSALTKKVYKLLYMWSVTDNLGTVINYFTLLFFQLKALTRLHQLKLLGHTLVVEFAKEQDRVHSPCPSLGTEKKKRYVDRFS